MVSGYLDFVDVPVFVTFTAAAGCKWGWDDARIGGFAASRERDEGREGHDVATTAEALDWRRHHDVGQA